MYKQSGNTFIKKRIMAWGRSLWKKGWVVSIILFLSIICPIILSASFLLHLKNGKKVLTDKYWKEGDMIKFYYANGVIGLPQEFIEGIKESDSPAPKPRQKVQKETETTQGENALPGRIRAEEGGAKGNEGLKERQKTQGKTEEDSLFQDQKETLEARLKEEREVYKQAQKYDERETMGRQRERIINILGELETLKKEVIQKNHGRLPEWWEFVDPE